MEGYDNATYGERFAAVYDEWYDQITDADACARLVVELAGASTVLELGVGTGRLALPIAALGTPVVGVDASAAMLERLAEKQVVGSATVEGVLGDMADLPFGERRFGVVFVAYNTLFNLVDPDAQQRCLASAARCLAPGGSVVVEAFVPSTSTAEESVAPRTIAADRVVLSVSRSDPDSQEALGQYVDITEAGIKLRPWHIRWSTPAQLDEMAVEAGLVLADRWSDWERSSFDASSPAHVSRYVAVD